jgi:agmatinase
MRIAAAAEGGLVAAQPTYAVPPTYLGTTRTDRGAAVCVAGIPFDLGTTNRAGARFGPQAIRHASRMLVDGAHPGSWIDPAELALADIGDFALAFGDIGASLSAIEDQARGLDHLVTLGGDHTITLPLLRALSQRTGPLGLVHFDAHVDTWPDCFGQKLSHGSVFYNAIEEGLVEPRRTVQIGIRSPMPRTVHEWTEGRGVTIVPAEAVHDAGPAAVAARVAEVVGDGPAYLTFDVDALDPAFAPGTGTPEVGGLATWQVRAILRRLGGLAFRGMDVVEVAPPYDVAEITALAAATVAWEYLMLDAARAAGRP